MSTVQELTAEIHRLAAKRQRLWRDGDTSGECGRVSAQLADAYAARRAVRAKDEFGNPADIVKRARIESELERLMVTNEQVSG